MSAGLQLKWDLISRKECGWDVSITKEIQGKACLGAEEGPQRNLSRALVITAFPRGCQRYSENVELSVAPTTWPGCHPIALVKDT